MEGGRERLSCFARNERFSAQGKKVAEDVAGIGARRRVSADGLRSDMPNRGRDLGVNLKTRPEMTLAGVVVLHVTHRNDIGPIIRSALGGVIE